MFLSLVVLSHFICDLFTSAEFYFQLVCTKMRVPKFGSFHRNTLLVFIVENAGPQLLQIFGHFAHGYLREWICYIFFLYMSRGKFSLGIKAPD